MSGTPHPASLNIVECASKVLAVALLELLAGAAGARVVAAHVDVRIVSLVLDVGLGLAGRGARGRGGNAGGGASVSLGMIVGACAILPFGVASAGTSMFSMSVLPLALLLGVFSSALPYGLEIVALKQLPAQTFGILMSMEPVLAALSGIIFLGEQLNVAQWVALACIIVASIGATLTIRRKA